MIFAEGNNREATKFKKVDILIPFQANINAYGRYYLPELPEIDKSKITGIQLNTRVNFNNTNTTVDQLPFINPNYFYEGFQSGNASLAFTAYTTLSLVNSDDQLIIDQYPINQLISGQFVAGQKKIKIIPFDCKIKTRKSYITFLYPLVLAQPSQIIINLTFFYRDPE